MAEEVLNFERQEDAVRIGKHWWQLEVSAARIKEAIAPLREQVEKLKGLLMAQPARDRGPEDYDRDDDVRLIAKAFERMADRIDRLGHGPNYGGVNGSSKLGWLVTLNIGITLGVSAWIVSNIIDQGRQIAVIQCQLSPGTCPQVPPRGSP